MKSRNIPNPKNFEEGPTVWKQNYGSDDEKRHIEEVKTRLHHDAIEHENRVLYESSAQYRIDICKTYLPYILGIAYLTIVVICFVFGINYKNQGINWAWLGPGIAILAIPFAYPLFVCGALSIYVCCGSQIK